MPEQLFSVHPNSASLTKNLLAGFTVLDAINQPAANAAQTWAPACVL